MAINSNLEDSPGDLQRTGSSLDGMQPMASKPVKSLHRVRRSEDDRERRLRRGYVEAPSTLAKALEAGFERTREKLAVQREETRHAGRGYGASRA